MVIFRSNKTMILELFYFGLESKKRNNNNNNNIIIIIITTFF